MAMEVRNRLGDDIVHRNEGPLRSARVTNGDRQELGADEERLDQMRGKVGERLVMPAGDQERVPVEERAHIEECKAVLVVQYDVRGLIPGDDPAEQAVRQRS